MKTSTTFHSVCALLVTLLFWGCDKDHAVSLNLTVNIAALSAEEKASIDRVEVVIAGLHDPVLIQEPAAEVFTKDQAVLATETIPLMNEVQVFIRASVYAGDFEVAGQTQLVTLRPNSKVVEQTFELYSPISPNGCRLVQPPSVVGLPAESDIHTFDVTSDGFGGYMLAYSDRSTSNSNIHTVKLDAAGKAGTQPIRLISTDSRSAYPLRDASTPRAIAADGGFLIFWSEEKQGTNSQLIVAKVACEVQ